MKNVYLDQSPREGLGEGFQDPIDAPAEGVPGQARCAQFPQAIRCPKKSKASITVKAKELVSENIHNDSASLRTGVNLGDLYKPTVFTREPLPEESYDAEKDEPVHLALVKLRQPQKLTDRTLGDIALTLSQMAQLGLSTAVVLDCDEDTSTHSIEVKPEYGNMVREQALRLVAALEDHNEPGSLLVEDALGYSPVNNDMPSTTQVRGGVEVQHTYLLFPPIDDGVIPVIAPFAYDENLKKVRVQADDVLLALVREFAGLGHSNGMESPRGSLHKTKRVIERPLLDRIIILDPLGGIPSENRADGAHVFVNLEAEYRDIKKELQQLSSKTSNGNAGSATSLSTGNPLSSFFCPPNDFFIVTDVAHISVPGVCSTQPPTFLKKGIPLTMIPDPRVHGPWQPPSASNPSIELADDPRINFPKLVDLINDSFQRKLHPKNYLDRIRGRVAGIIIAGDYEGGAICTWETPKTLQGANPPSFVTPDSPYWIPYLDKFAVLTSSQGSGGVSDIVWAALTRTCFPDGVVWRSRTSNPVNKWYQERSKGMWKLPGDQWTMFWTTEGIVGSWEHEKWGDIDAKKRSMKRWDACIDVCSGIEPSWADGIQRDD
ncbi:hypothetical protein PTNB73_02575 [Pyrenophora teres f. teres]|nr:hypothetical protein PTNB73_02575 [Pyrenophora teres f. teres]